MMSLGPMLSFLVSLFGANDHEPDTEENTPLHLAAKQRTDHKVIPDDLDVINTLGKEKELSVESAKQKVDLRHYNSNLVFKTGEYIVSYYMDTE